MSKVSGHIPAGGPASKVVTSSRYHLGQGARKILPAATAELGQRQGNHISGDSSGGGAYSTSWGGARLDAGVFPMGSVGADKFGNQVAVETKCGPGGSRTVYKAGFQSQHGSAPKYGDKVK
jgi:hypothetical protein